MDDIRHSLSKTKKKLEQRLTGRKPKQDGTGANPGGERADSTSSLPQPEPPIVVDESHDQEGDGANTAGEPVFSTDQSPQPESVPARGSDNGQEGEEAGADVEEEAGQKDSYLDLHVDVAVGGGHSGELEGVYLSPSTPSISHGIEPDST